MTAMTFAAAPLTGIGYNADLRDRLQTLTNVCRTATDDPAFLSLFAEAIKEAAREAVDVGTRRGSRFLAATSNSLYEFMCGFAITTSDHVRMICAHVQALTHMVAHVER